MTASKVDLTLERGTDVSESFSDVDSAGAAIDLSSYTATAVLLNRMDDDTAVLTRTVNDGIVVSGVAGTFTVTWPAASLSAMAPDWSGYRRITLNSGSFVQRLIEGSAWLKP